MCRLLAIASPTPLEPVDLVSAFAERCRDSKEYQGHGWGIAWRSDAGWSRHRSIRPIWDDARPGGIRSTMWLVHARSAFRDEGIVVENNMPFLEGDLAFGFNGELRGVRLSAPGETGAARLLHLLSRFRRTGQGDLLGALERLDRVVTARAEYVRAMNIVAADLDRLYVHSHYGEDPGYFTLHIARREAEGGAATVVSSEPLSAPCLTGWEPIANHTTLSLEPVSC